ncbi:putative anti-sigma-YlaC factor YlaD [Micromonospora vinacea]|uniref:Anti-sigma-YlaC factor YlaD n=1 Tax=Micromonospora vinacea TaxID=709878 RepID=A0ABS0K034_9ACTN|nr:zf-HC2 domain-containing protein [Micromonospora vinacea]MBG6101983.1 putative anti-sigma-YlaC factor YlaD [Micromonospora vinacea]WTA68303.1 zf-HC2 domain-containing protein [Micromonospora sp. NBC_00855]
MGCEQWREVLSAQLDGEETAAELTAVQGHLDGCAECRAWFTAAATVTRRVRTRLVVEVPDRTAAILAAAAAAPAHQSWWRRRRGPLVAGLRSALGLLGAVQLVLGLAQVGRGATTDHLHPTGQHLWHESAAWNVAVGAGFLFVALRRSPPAGLLPMLSAFVGTLLLLSVNDLATGSVGGERLISHGFLVVGYLITVLLSRPGLRPGGPAPQRQPTPSRWRFGADEVDRPLRVVRPESYPAQAADRFAAPAAQARHATRSDQAGGRRAA